jgi:hypothetical protein
VTGRREPQGPLAAARVACGPERRPVERGKEFPAVELGARARAEHDRDRAAALGVVDERRERGLGQLGHVVEQHRVEAGQGAGRQGERLEPAMVHLARVLPAASASDNGEPAWGLPSIRPTCVRPLGPPANQR